MDETTKLKAFDQVVALMPHLTYPEIILIGELQVELVNAADKRNGVFAEAVKGIFKGPCFKAALASREPIDTMIKAEEVSA